MEIPQNNNLVTKRENEIIEKMKSLILKDLEADGVSRIYSYGTPYKESYAKEVGAEFAKRGYFVAFDYVPNGYRNITVSRRPIGRPSGRLVSREFL